MFARYSITFDEIDYTLPDHSIEVGKAIKGAKLNTRTSADERLENTKDLLNNRHLNMNEIADIWFPQPKETPHIFISHSHADIKNKNFYFLIGFLKKKFGINCFIDAWEWGDYRELLKLIDDEYCVAYYNNGNTIYSYEDSSYTNSTFSTLLLTSLLKIMDQTETFFFLKSDHSTNDLKSITNSAWIWAENQATTIIRRKRPERSPTTAIDSALEAYSFVPSFTLEELPSLTYKDIREWHKASSTSTSDAEGALDKLYELYPNGCK